MPIQPSLFDENEPRTIQDRFEAYHAKHPEVYDMIVRFARLVKEKGRKQYGIAAIYERVRWEYHIERGEEEYKLNNDFRSRYSRLIEDREEDLVGFFETRSLKAD